MRPQVYTDPRAPERFRPFHDRARGGRPGWVYDLTRLLVAPYMLALHRVGCRNRHNVPPVGPAIIAPNHFSFLDHFTVALFLRRKVRFMAKSQLFRPPLEWWLAGVGAFPVMRGRRDEEAIETARRLLDAGELLIVYIEGGRSRDRALGRPRPGVGRLALETGAPVVPTAIAGSERARDWGRLVFPRIRVAYGRPVRFNPVEAPTGAQAQAASELVFEDVTRLHEELRRGMPEPLRERLRRRAGAVPLIGRLTRL